MTFMQQYTKLSLRGISLLSCVGKLYLSILSNIIVSYSNISNILDHEQNEFRKHRFCSDHIFTLSDVIQNRLQENKTTVAAFLDKENLRSIKYVSLLEYGIADKMNSIKHMHYDNKSSILLNNVSTDWFNVTSGVKQGDALYRMLFSLFIN